MTDTISTYDPSDLTDLSLLDLPVLLACYLVALVERGSFPEA